MTGPITSFRKSPPTTVPNLLENPLDANLLHCLASGASLTACLHFCNQTPTDWYSKKQATVETATYESEFVAAKTATEQIMDLRYTLRY